ncbi:Uncharacterised protein [Vibrio cholerae]|nr:Uncharacterised protein [Vibrio cholerae]
MPYRDWHRYQYALAVQNGQEYRRADDGRHKIHGLPLAKLAASQADF